jgi:hypothetical protein
MTLLGVSIYRWPGCDQGSVLVVGIEYPPQPLSAGCLGFRETALSGWHKMKSLALGQPCCAAQQHVRELRACNALAVEHL